MKIKKTRAAVTISMPKDMAEEYDKLAKRRDLCITPHFLVKNSSKYSLSTSIRSIYPTVLT
jgi:hypothetical protein